MTELKIKYICKEDLIEEFVKENPKYKGKKLEVHISDTQYNIVYNRKSVDYVVSGKNEIFKEAGRIFGYARISTSQQNIERQVRNIMELYPTASIIQETYTGTKIDRPEWNKLYKKVKKEDTIVFDSVSRMSRNADEGFALYEELYNKSVNLIFLKEPHINTETYKKALSHRIDMTGDKVDLILEGVNQYLMELAKEQIRIAFEQSEKEVRDLSQRTKEGIKTARDHGKQIGQKSGKVLNIKKKEPAKEVIIKHCKDFGGSLSDAETMLLAKLSRNTYYKYKREIKETMQK